MKLFEIHLLKSIQMNYPALYSYALKEAVKRAAGETPCFRYCTRQVSGLHCCKRYRDKIDRYALDIALETAIRFGRINARKLKKSRDNE